MFKFLYLAYALLILSSVSALAVTCSQTGEVPDKPESGLIVKVLKWTSDAEANLKLKPPGSRDDAMKLQAIAADWAGRAPYGSVDYFFRQALLHGINVQYENWSIIEDTANTKQHEFWVNAESARAEACLDLVSPTR